MVLTTILVGCDLSPSADQAIDRATGIAELHGASIVLVHAQAEDPSLSEIDRDAMGQLGEVSAAIGVHEARALADRMTQIEARGVAVELVSRIDPPDEVITEAAAERQAELIVIGSHGHTGIARMLIGSVASSTIRHATCDVLVCRGPAARAPFQRPLVATDFSPVASKVLTHAARVSAPGADTSAACASPLDVTGEKSVAISGRWNGARAAGPRHTRTSHVAWRIVEEATVPGSIRAIPVGP